MEIGFGLQKKEEEIVQRVVMHWSCDRRLWVIGWEVGVLVIGFYIQLTRDRNSCFWVREAFFFIYQVAENICSAIHSSSVCVFICEQFDNFIKNCLHFFLIIISPTATSTEKMIDINNFVCLQVLCLDRFMQGIRYWKILTKF